MNYQTAFPGFVLDVAIPEHFRDTSEKANAMPTWEHDSKAIVLYVNFINPDEREIFKGVRFVVCDNGTEGEELYSSDDYSKVLEYIAAAPDVSDAYVWRKIAKKFDMSPDLTIYDAKEVREYFAMFHAAPEGSRVEPRAGLKLSPIALKIFNSVVEAMQAAEELGGPDGQEYLDLMDAIQDEARGRFNNAEDAAR